MARGGNTARPLDIEKNDEAIEINSGQSEAANTNDLEITGVSGDGVTTETDGNVVTLKLNRTPPKASSKSRPNQLSNALRTPPVAPAAANDNTEPGNAVTKTPPKVAATDDTVQSFDDDMQKPLEAPEAASPFVGTASNDDAPSPDNLEKGGIAPAESNRAIATGDKNTPEQTPTLNPNQQTEAATDLQAAQQASAHRSPTPPIDNAAISFDKTPIPPAVLAAIKRFPGVSMLLRQFESGDPKNKVKTLQRLLQLLQWVKSGAMALDTGEFFLATLGTIIIPILMILGLPIILVWIFFLGWPTTPTAAKIDEMIKICESMIEPLQKQQSSSERRPPTSPIPTKPSAAQASA